MDYLIIEAVNIKASREEREAQEAANKKAEMDQRKKEAIQALKEQFPAKGR